MILCKLFNRNLGLIVLLILFITAFQALLATDVVQEDVVYMKNGTIYRGTLIEVVPNKSAKLKLPSGGTVFISMDEVAKITKEDPEKKDDKLKLESTQDSLNNNLSKDRSKNAMKAQKTWYMYSLSGNLNFSFRLSEWAESDETINGSNYFSLGYNLEGLFGFKMDETDYFTFLLNTTFDKTLNPDKLRNDLSMVGIGSTLIGKYGYLNIGLAYTYRELVEPYNKYDDYYNNSISAYRQKISNGINIYGRAYIPISQYFSINAGVDMIIFDEYVLQLQLGICFSSINNYYFK